jgi:hypothetical protein
LAFSLSPTISPIFSLTPHSIFCVSRGFMLRPFPDSTQLPRFIHPNISYSVSHALLCASLRSVFAAFCVTPHGGSAPFSHAAGVDTLASCARVLALALRSISRQSPCFSVLLLTDCSLLLSQR